MLFTSHYYHKLLLVVTLLRKENFAKGTGGKTLTDKHSLEIWQMLSFHCCVLGRSKCYQNTSRFSLASIPSPFLLRHSPSVT